MRCDLCTDKACKQGRDCLGERDNVVQNMYSSPEDQKIMQVAAAIEVDFYFQKSRLEELIIFCRGMNYKHLGVVFCLGLEKEARILCTLLRKYFTVSSVCCRICGVPKEDLGLKKRDPHKQEIICNPLMQAKVLEDEHTELNIIAGLCLGHDILFTKYSHAPVTTLIVKDRLLAHNPVGAIYSRYYTSRIERGGKVEEIKYD
ncbi:MAG: DUF1847 domain-containing protein [Firmicutes bacterium]|nr:DUF1847 domain-containing protein [Bacillota bacterium]